MQELVDLVTENPTATMERKEKKDGEVEMKKKKKGEIEEPSTSEEKFLDAALQNLRLHAKAKLLVNDMVTQVKSHNNTEESEPKPKPKRGKKQTTAWDTFSEWANFAEIIKKLNGLLLDEDPILAQRMGIV